MLFLSASVGVPNVLFLLFWWLMIAVLMFKMFAMALGMWRREKMYEQFGDSSPVMKVLALCAMAASLWMGVHVAILSYNYLIGG